MVTPPVPSDRVVPSCVQVTRVGSASLYTPAKVQDTVARTPDCTALEIPVHGNIRLKVVESLI